MLDRLWVRLGFGHLIGAASIGTRPHDCGPLSVYWTVPKLSEETIKEAFLYCSDSWPYGGVTNKEFNIALKFLKVDAEYRGETETLGELLDRRPKKCVALLYGHYVAIMRGRIVGRDRGYPVTPDSTVYCHWLVGSN